MSFDGNQSPGHEQDDKESRQWSTVTAASMSHETGGQDESTASSMAPTPHGITAETVSRIPMGYNKTEESIASSTGSDFLERQVKRDQQEEHLNTKHVSAITVSLQQYSDIIGLDHSQVDPQADMLVGLQMHMDANPPTGTLADLHVDLIPTSCPERPALPPIKVDDNDDATFEAYATAYRLRPPGTTRLDSGVRNTMRQEAAFDDAIFQPLRLTSHKTVFNRRIAAEDVGAVAVLRTVRKRKRETKDTH